MNNEVIVFFSGFGILLCCFTMEEVMGIGDSQENRVNDIKQELCCELDNNPGISINSEAGNSMCNNTEDLRLKDDSGDNVNINQSLDQHQNPIDVVQIKHELNDDSDIEVDCAYRIIDTLNVCEIKTFKQENVSFDKTERACITENVDYENQKSEDDVNKLHSQGM